MKDRGREVRALLLSAVASSLAFAACGRAATPQADTTRVPGRPVVESLPVSGGGSLRGTAVWGADTVWVSGTGGTVRRSADAGRTWSDVAPPGTGLLDFRDIQLFDADTALVMSAGHGALSSVYRTADGGATWQRVLQNNDPAVFFNSIAFWDGSRGLLTSDSQDGQLFLLRTLDAGATWTRVGQASLPPLVAGEAGFAASGTVVATSGSDLAWIATGGGAARVFHTADAGDTWSVFDTPLPGGVASRGIFSVTFRDARRGVIVGGDYLAPEIDAGNAAWSDDGGTTWNLAAPPPGSGLPYRSCVQHLGAGRYLAVGHTGGLAFSEDDGRSWSMIDGPAFNTIGYDAESGVGYLAGGEGRVDRFTTRREG